jgi:hypothetical protein
MEGGWVDGWIDTCIIGHMDGWGVNTDCMDGYIIRWIDMGLIHGWLSG